MKKEAILKPCPFCGNKNNDYFFLQAYDDSDNSFYIHCYLCGTYGPIEESEQEAIEKWNQRI